MEALERVQLSEEFNDKLRGLLTEYRQLFGPAIDPVTDELCDHPTDPCPCLVSEGYVPTNFVLVSNWTDMGTLDGEQLVTGEDWMDTTASLNMLRSQIIGLMTMALDGARGISVRGH